MENNKRYNSKKLWHILLDLDMTTQELARRSGVSVSSLARLKNGIPLSYNKMRKICDVVGCENVDDIIEDVHGM